MTDNPYESPAVDVTAPAEDVAEKNQVPPVVLAHLRGTRPWVKFCSLSGYITAVFIIIVDFIVVRKIYSHLPQHQTLLFALFYLVLAILFIIPSLRLSKYEKSITRLSVSNHIEDLEQAIAHQRMFWKQMGIMILILFILYLVTIGLSAIVLLTSKF